MPSSPDYEQYIQVRKQIVERAIIYPIVVLFWGGMFWQARTDPVAVRTFVVFAGVTIAYAEFQFRQIEKGGITISVRNGILEYYDSARRRHFMMNEIVRVSGPRRNRGIKVTFRNSNSLNLYAHKDMVRFLEFLKSQAQVFGYEVRVD